MTKTPKPADEGSFDSMISEETALATTVDSPVGRTYTDSPDFESDDITYPRLRLAQGLTQEVQDGVARPGEWVLAGYDSEKSVVLVPLMAAKYRELRGDDDEGVLCSSPDAKVGVGNPGGNCAECPLAKWRPNPKDPKKNLPPACGLGYSYVAYSVTHDAVVSVDFKKSATTTAKAINTMIASRGLRNFALTLTSKSNQGPKGTYSTPAVVPAKISEDDLERARLSLGN